ncbi:NAD dependent epimerase/dehydratase [Aspergillus sclerotioniger CBS 115572]|uniref:NAD dependent epimerase/dehydratase n=1 Tax=Aspergillus sclerotioniger CBS 115572 TaxID=1450535 RepID=A0A317X3N9_9EURO|nr:NAD dependent epimerase/dehydratase [Aspergillus sclerotioniger CBS 115572]PWY93229.1 NAD dependent epimerase/dehydratase [Aspergillus sclerotioniger CBS 115572]
MTPQTQPPKQTKTLFLTGGSGFIGTALIPLAITDHNYTVRALSRTPSSDTKLTSLGAIPIRGDLTSHALLREETRTADAIIHLATAYQFGVHASYDEVKDIDMAAVDAIFQGLHDSTPAEKPFVITSGTLIVVPDPTGNETDETSPLDPNPINSRGELERYVLEKGAEEQGVRAISIRLAPYVYGHGGSGVRRWMEMAAAMGRVMCVGGGGNRITTVHVEDAAELYLLAAERGGRGEVYNASGETGVTAREMFGAVAEIMDVAVGDIGVEEAEGKMGMVVARFLSARRELGWVSRGRGILEEIKMGSYREVVGEVKKGRA